MKNQKQIPASAYQSGTGFINHYQNLIKDVVIPYQYEVLCDNVEGVEKSHVIANFVNAGKALRGEDIGDGFYGMVFQDSDAAKWLEAVAFSLTVYADKKLEAKADALIDIIAAAQDSDGYLNTYFTIKDRDKRWKNLMEGHELYCSGHMMEAAVAYFDATGKDVLLNVMLRNAEHIYTHFITEKNEGYPGHPEVELALLKMYRTTKNQHCLDLAKHFLDVRGVNPHFYEEEAKLRDWTVWGNDPYDHDYMQAGKPVREQTDATGHSVRAVYLYTAMADLASEIEDVELQTACRKLWESITQRRMYVTGGIGSTVLGEAFTVDYDLPNDTAYAETCASIGLMFFASRMLELDTNGEYADIMERAFYNTVLAGMQLDGKRFFYVNPLEILPGISGIAATHKHDLPERPGWYACACCPPNVARTISSFGTYAYGENDTTAFCHLFAEGTIHFENGLELLCETNYPYAFTITYTVKKGSKALALRIPNWSTQHSILVNNKTTDYEIRKGYAYLPCVQAGDKIVLSLDTSVHHIYTSTKVAENTGCVALQRGPLVYCFEGVDNDNDILSLSLTENGQITINPYAEDLLCGTTTLTVSGWKMQQTEDLYSIDKRPEEVPYTLTAIPYYTWGNRGLSQMRIWMTDK